MSDELPLQDKSARFLRDDEKALLIALLSRCNKFSDFEKEITFGKVYDMLDGGMGSVKFIATEERSFGENIVEANYLDEDGILVIITVIGDDRGGLYELDFWKTDFSSLKKYPQPGSVKIKN